MTTADEFQQLSDDLAETFGVSATYTRPSGFTENVTTGARVPDSELSATITVVQQETRQYHTFGPEGSKMNMEETIFLIDAAAFTAASLSNPREGDTITAPAGSGPTRRVTGVHLQVGGKVWKVVCRAERRRA